jgi:hypothetical protein
MDKPINADSIRLRRKRSGERDPAPLTPLTLRQKLDRLFDQGFVQDDLFAMVVPLLMQGKVRLDIGNDSERLELEDQTLRQTRPHAIAVFEDYLGARRNKRHGAETVAQVP